MLDFFKRFFFHQVEKKVLVGLFLLQKKSQPGYNALKSEKKIQYLVFIHSFLHKTFISEECAGVSVIVYVYWLYLENILSNLSYN